MNFLRFSSHLPYATLVSENYFGVLDVITEPV